MYVVGRLVTHLDLKTNLPHQVEPLRFKTVYNWEGVLPVFKTEKQARKASENGKYPILKIEEVNN